MINLAIYILGGGESRRFGADKARARLGGEALIEGVRDALGEVHGVPSVVADVADKYADLGLRTLGDSGRYLGPIDGLRVALEDLPREADWLLLVACDLVGLQAAWVDALSAGRREEVDAVIFDVDRPQPLFALYHRRCQTVVVNQIAHGHYAMWRLLKRLRLARVEAPEGFPALININRPSDLDRFRGSGL